MSDSKAPIEHGRADGFLTKKFILEGIEVCMDEEGVSLAEAIELFCGELFGDPEILFSEEFKKLPCS